MSWFLFCILSIFALATAELMQQKLLNGKDSFSPRTSVVLTFLFQSLLTLPFIIFTPLRNELFIIFEFSTLYKFIFVTFIASFAVIFYLKSFQVKNISVSTIFVSSSILISTSLGIIFLHEGLYFAKILGILFILGSIVSLNIKNASLEKNHWYGLFAGLIFGLAFILDKNIITIGAINPFVYIFWSFSLVALFGFLLKPQEVIKDIANKKLNDYTQIAVSGSGYFLFNFFTFNSYILGGEVGRVDAINNSQIFLIILFEFFILRHKTSLVRKLITAMIAFTGVMILGFSRRFQ